VNWPASYGMLGTIAAARAAEIIVDNLDGGPAKLTSAIGKTILPTAALMIVRLLIGRRLADHGPRGRPALSL
jgi:hypothetical protein